MSELFAPEIGYVQRRDMRRSSADLRFSPRPRNSCVIRKLSWEGRLDYITDARRTSVLNREAKGTFGVDFQNGDQCTLMYTDDYELLPQNFAIVPEVIVPAGGYRYAASRAQYTLGQQRRVSGTLFAGRGSFYGGTKSEAGYSGRVALLPQFAIEPSVSLNFVDLPQGRFTNTLVTSRFVVAPTARMLLSSLVQYNGHGHSLNASIRLRRGYTMGSE